MAAVRAWQILEHNDLSTLFGRNSNSSLSLEIAYNLRFMSRDLQDRALKTQASNLLRAREQIIVECRYVGLVRYLAWQVVLV